MDMKTIKEFLDEKGDKAIEYDFSNDGAGTGYKELAGGKEKFLAYMMVIKKDYFYGDNEQYPFFKKASELLKEKIKEYGSVFDPDSKSKLLQEIYKVLWDIEPINMRDGITIEGDTLNSANTTLNKLYEFIEGEVDKGKEEIETERYKRESMKTEKGTSQSVSIKFILSKYLNEGNFEILNKIFENKEVETFLMSYHSLGNFMPIPEDCNGPRGTGALKDYWDLTLLHIYKYYQSEKADEIVKIIGNSHKEVYKEWLDSFGNWNTFVERNYLGDYDGKENFVSKEKEGANYGKPRELWKGHFDQTGVEPINDDGKGIEQCLEYFRNASAWISTRGNLMKKELEKKI